MVDFTHTFFLTRLSKWLTIILLLFCVMTLPALLELRLSNDFRVYFSSDNPELNAYELFEEDFTSHDSLVIIGVLDDPTDSWLLPQYHQLLLNIEDALWTVPTVHRVSTLTNYQFTEVDGDNLSVSAVIDLLRQQVDTETSKRDQINPDFMSLLERDPQLKGVFLSSDQLVIAFQADLYLDRDSPLQARTVYDFSNDLRQQWQTQNPEIDFYLLGSISSNVTLEDAVADDFVLLVPLTYLVLTLGLIFFLRSYKATLVTLVITTLSIVFSFSIFALFKTELTPVAGFVPTVILTLAVADCVHYLTSYRYLMIVEKKTSLEANLEAFKINWLPISITSVTTAMGVLFLNLSDSPPYRDLGNMVAIGVILAWLFTLLILPALLKRYPIEYSTQKQTLDLIGADRMSHYASWLKKNHAAVSASMIVLVVISIYGVTQIRFSENWSRYFSESFEVTRAINIIKDKFDRLHRYELVLRGDSENAINSPEYLEILDQLLDFLEQHPKVEQIQSYGYILKRLNQTMNQDKPDFFAMPDTQTLAAQLLLMYELSLPQGAGVENFVTFDKSASRTTLLLKPSESYQLIEFETELREFYNGLELSPEHSVTLEISGLDHIFSHIAERNIHQMIMGTSLALLIISLLLMVIYKSVKYGLVSLIPNLIPALIAYGLWGMSVGYIDLALSVVICMSLGIVVDDSVHFLSKYVHAKRHKQLSTDASINYSFHVVGRALITTTVILVAGFSMMLLSPLLPTANTGALLCITLVMALIVDFTLLPNMLRKVDAS